MDFRSLVNKLELIENQDLLLEAGLRLKKIIADIAGTETNDQARIAKLAQIAQQAQLPGLYDPVSGKFVNQDGSTSSSADKETDKKLAYMGLIPQNATTSTWLGKTFGVSGDKYDADIRSTSKGAMDAQDLEDQQLEQIKELAELITQYQALKAKRDQAKKDYDAKVAARKGKGGKAVANTGNTPNIAKPLADKPAPGNTDPTKGAVDYSLTGGLPKSTGPGIKLPTATEGVQFKSSIAQSLVESFGYQAEGEIVNNIAAGTAGYAGGKIASKIAGKAIPGVATGLSWYDAYRRAKAGDLVGAGIAGLAGAVALIPGVGWIPALGLDMANVGRDLAGGGMTGKEPEDGQGGKLTGNQHAQMVMKVQKIIGAKPDGLTGPETKAKLQAWQQKHGLKADGLIGPETTAAMKIQEGTTMKTAAEQYRDLVNKLEMLENELPEPEVTEGADDQAIMFSKDGKNYAMVPGPNGEAIIVDEQGNEVDGNTLQVIGKADLAEAGWTSALANVFKNFKSGLAGGAKTGVRSAAGKFTKAGTVATAANRTGKFIGKNPVKTALATGALGGLAGYAAGGGGGQDTFVPPKPPTPTTGPTTPTVKPDPEADPDVATNDAEDRAFADQSAQYDKELADMRAKIDALIGNLSKSGSKDVQTALAPVAAQWKTQSGQ